MRYTAAVIQFNPSLGANEENLRRLLALNEEAAGAGARLIVNPEMSVPGYCFRDRSEAEPSVEPVPGPSTHAFAEVAHRLGCVIVFGVAEEEAETGLYYNTAVVVGPEGYIGKYRKVHFFASDARFAVEGSDGFPVWDTPVGRIGIEICMDATYPESGRLLAVGGADVICFPTNWVGTGGVPDDRWISQAFENGCYFLAADRSDSERGIEFMGASCLIAPDGRVEALAREGEEIVYGTVDLDRTKQRAFDEAGPEDKLASRRPDLYHEMLQNTYGWSPTYFQSLYGDEGLPPPRSSRLGVLQMRPAPGMPNANRSLIWSQAGHERLDLLILPALGLTGFPTTREQAVTWSVLDVEYDLRTLSAELGCSIVTSIIERAGDGLYHTVVLADIRGIEASHRSTHLGRNEADWAQPGDKPPRAVDTPFGRLGLLSGFEALFWENLRLLATQGSDLLCIPAGLRWPQETPILNTGHEWNHWRAKAWEACAALALANYPGPEHAGGSGIFIPQVRIERTTQTMTGDGSPWLGILEFDTESKYIREKRSLSWRRLDMYRPLVMAPDRARLEATMRSGSV